MSPKYKCNDCGFVWNDIQVEENESNFFLRCIRCESRNISLPTKSKKVKFMRKLIFWLFFSITTGIMGAAIGYITCFSVQANNCWLFVLVGFLIGLLVPLFIILRSGW